MTRGMMYLTDQFPIVPRSGFTKIRGPHLSDVWHLVGPTINANRHRNYQDQLCIAFVEGMRMALHASGQTGDEK